MKGINSKQTGALGFLDTLIVMLNLAAGRGNYLLYGLTGLNSMTYILTFVLVVDVVYFFFKIKSISILHERFSIFLIVFLLLAYNALNALLHGGAFNFDFEVLLIWFFFAQILVYQKNKLEREYPYDIRDGVSFLFRPYYLLSMISIIGIIVSFVALNMNIVTPRVISADYMEANTMDTNSTYTWALLTCVGPTAEVRIPFFQDYGYLSGLFHEPHILCLNLFPCYILMLGLTNKMRDKIFVIVLAILTILFSGSVTNILVTVVCLIVFLFIKFKSSPVASTFILLLTIAGVYIYLRLSDDTFLSFVLGRLEQGNSSAQYSEDLLSYTFSPKTFFGSEIFSTAFMNGDTKGDVGYIPFFMFIIFLVLYIRTIIKLIFSGDSVSLSIGLASMYYILHSAKIGLTMFMQTLPVLLMMLQVIGLSRCRRTHSNVGINNIRN